MLASASGDHLVKVWDLSDVDEKRGSVGGGKCAATFQGHKDQLVKVQWINMGLQVVSASVDGVVKIWNVKK
jgi:U3 small nucleolar RNA-associated protein 13